jgi:hypothetical protein
MVENMENEMRKQIDNVKNWKQFLNENVATNNDNMLVELENEYYIASNDKINVGDWFYCSDNTNYAYIFKCIGLTDDTHLQVSNENIFGGYGSNDGGYGDWDIDYSHKIIASTKMLDGIKYLKLKKADIFNR